MAEGSAAGTRLLSASAIGPFSWRWPDGTEHFDRGWAAIADVDGRHVHVRHGIGRREVFGRPRVHSVTWLEGQPIVEGVEADDYENSESLLSLIKVTKRHLRPGDPVPPGYRAFPVVVMAEEARGAYSPRSLALKLRRDDIEGWMRHAVCRAIAWGRLPGPRRERATLPPPSATGRQPAATAWEDAGEHARRWSPPSLHTGRRSTRRRTGRHSTSPRTPKRTS